MSKTCQILGTRAGVGNRVSHSHRKTRRTFAPNLQSKRYWVPSLQRHVTLTVSAKARAVSRPATVPARNRSNKPR
mgnify:CR=1 FL=1